MGAYTWPQVLNPLLRREDLEATATAWAMEQILSGAASPAQLAGFVIALRSKGETVTEVEGLVATMREFAGKVSVPGRTLDVVGTGGDQAHTVNISTMSAIVAAGAGAKVVKHGNRAASSACGAADVLELGQIGRGPLAEGQPDGLPRRTVVAVDQDLQRTL